MNTEKRLFLLDAYALIFRAYYALIKMPRITKSGFNTSAIFGFVNTLEEVIRKEKPTHIAVCFDPQGPTFRSEAFAEYKGEREATPEDIKLSIPIIKDIIRAYRIPILEVEGFEADDVIGTMARRGEAEGFTTYMMTPDKDFGQLVSPNILQYKPAYRGQDFELRGEQEVCERYGIERTSQVIDLLALMGDKIDNIPGCPGVGEKTAVKLIHDYGSVENLLENVDSLKGALRKRVEENAEQIRFSKYLATIRTDVPVDATPDSLKYVEPDKDKLFEIFRSLEFKSLIDRVGRRLSGLAGDKQGHTLRVTVDSGKGAGLRTPSLFDFNDDEEAESVGQPEDSLCPVPDERFVMTTDSRSLAGMQSALSDVEACGVMMLSEGENDMTARWVGTGIAVADGRAWYIPTDYDEGQAALLDLMARGDIRKVSCSSKRDYVIASRHRTDSAEALSNYYDVALAHYLLQPDMRHNISELASTYLKMDIGVEPPLSVRSGRGKNVRPEPVPPAELMNWGCRAALASLLLMKPLSEELRRLGEWSLLEDIELPLSRVLAEMELTGVCLDVSALNEAAETIRQQLSELENSIYELAGEEFNVSSPAKVGEILFDKLRLDDKAKKTKTGQYSTSEEVLEKIAHKSPIVGKILEYRQLKKLLTTYLTALPESINPDTGRVHTVYNQTVTATGRISSSSPNLQNIPVRENVGREIRRAFIPSPGNVFLSADYSQIELRLVSDFAGDETMLDAFRHGKDIHAITAAKIYHKDNIEDVTGEERRAAKTANFGILYGISAFGLASRLGIPRGEAKELIDNYFATFPTIHKYMSDSVERARETGYAITRMGRRRYLPDINSKNPVVRGYAERNAINAPVQGSAADIIKKAMVDIAREMRVKGLRSKMIMQVHDELNFDVVPEELPVLQEMVERLMSSAYSGCVNLTAESGVGANWLEAH
ncbi:MAG: DNA polymerase I [Muribaculaceae bacterium]|nr:DNA polymerase I [Muribaculaceae bacterium]